VIRKIVSLPILASAISRDEPLYLVISGFRDSLIENERFKSLEREKDVDERNHRIRKEH